MTYKSAANLRQMNGFFPIENEENGGEYEGYGENPREICKASKSHKPGFAGGDH